MELDSDTPFADRIQHLRNKIVYLRKRVDFLLEEHRRDQDLIDWLCNENGELQKVVLALTQDPNETES